MVINKPLNSSILCQRRPNLPQCPQKVQQVPWAAGLQHQVHGQLLGLAEQHPHQVLMPAHHSMELGPSSKLPSCGLAVAAWGCRHV